MVRNYKRTEGGDIVLNRAKCWKCEESLGKPQRVIHREEKNYTLYECCDEECDGMWYRSHNPSYSYNFY